MLDVLYPETYNPILFEKIRDIVATEDPSFKDSLKFYLLIDSVIHNDYVHQYIKDYIRDHIIKTPPKWFKAWLCLCDEFTIERIDFEDHYCDSENKDLKDLFSKILVSLRLRQNKDPSFTFDINLDLLLNRDVYIGVEEYRSGRMFFADQTSSDLFENIQKYVKDSKSKKPSGGSYARKYEADIRDAKIRINDIWEDIPYRVMIGFGNDTEQAFLFVQNNPMGIFDFIEKGDPIWIARCEALWSMLKNINIINLQIRG